MTRPNTQLHLFHILHCRTYKQTAKILFLTCVKTKTFSQLRETHSGLSNKKSNGTCSCNWKIRHTGGMGITAQQMSRISGNPLYSIFSSPLMKQAGLEIPALTKPGFLMVSNYKLRQELPAAETVLRCPRVK